MRILEVAHLVPGKFGSFEKYSLGFGVFLHQQGHQYHIFYLDRPCSALEKEIIRNGVSVSIMDCGSLGILSSLKLLYYIRKSDIDVVHFHFYPAYSFFTLISKFISCKVFFSYRISGEFSDNSMIVRLLKKMRSNFLGIGINGVFCVSDFARKKFINNYYANSNKTFVVHNGLNWDYFPKSQPEKISNVSNDEFKVICVAALIQEKGIEDILEAISMLKESVPGIYLTLVGAGRDQDLFENIVISKGLEKNVVFLGSRDDVPKLLFGSDVAVIPSRWGEAFGFTVIEAMAAGLPVVATSVGGIPEIIEHEKTGLLVPKERPDEIAQALLRLQKDKTLRLDLGKNARQLVKDYFNVKRVYEQQLGYYTKL